jgi:hypothetical protein
MTDKKPPSDDETPSDVTASPTATTAAVGYKRPPLATRFQPGVSGNPKGRPKRKPTFAEMMLEEAHRAIKVGMGDKVVKIPRAKALIRRTFDAALHGDPTALKLVMGHLATLVDPDADQPTEEPLSAEEIAILELLSKA